MLKHIYLFLCGLFFIISAYAQTGSFNVQEIQQKLNLYAKAHPSNLLFVHTDKTVYTNNETVWFSAYLLKDVSGSLKKHTVLSIAMVREDNHEILLQDKYVMDNGLSFGSLTLPDSIPPGNYQFIASTNVLDKTGWPLAVFIQPLTIKSITEQHFNARLSLLDTIVKNGVVRIKVSVKFLSPDPKQKAVIEYGIGKELNQPVTLKEDSYIINVSAAQLNQIQPILFTKVKYNEELQYLSLKLPENRSKKINVRFFPEGGNLTDELESIVAWETKTSSDLPVALKGVLYRDEQPVDTIETNSYGIGAFKLKPDGISGYTLKVMANNYLQRDTVYKLPKTVKNGIVLHLKEAIVKDTLEINIFSKQTRSIQVVIHNYRKMYAAFKAPLQASGKKLNVVIGPLIPKGIAAVTILDAEGRPLAEQLFFAHHDQGIKVGLQTSKPVYKRREKVNVKLKLADQSGKSAQGVLSVAVVQDNRLERSKLQDIESYVYLDHELGKFPHDPIGRGFGNKDYLENVFLIKGWRRYTWQGLTNSSVEDTIQNIQIRSSTIKGQVKYYGKALKKPVMMTVVSSTGLSMITTNNDGFFELTPDQAMTVEGKKILLSVNKDVKDGYTIEIEDPFKIVNEKLAGQVELQATGLARIEQSTEAQKLEAMEKVIALQTVTISANQADNSLFGAQHGTNACGDYVCVANVLNCPIHFNDSHNRKPEKGKMYTKIPNTNERILYAGCLAEESINIFNLKGIYTSREFYGVSSDPLDMQEPQFLSTLFWKPGIIPNRNGEMEFSFSTGDITGKFRIVIQGIGEKDMIFGETSFIVK